MGDVVVMAVIGVSGVIERACVDEEVPFVRSTPSAIRLPRCPP